MRKLSMAEPRAVSGVMVDGGTRFHAVFDPGGGFAPLRPMLEHLRRDDTPDAGLVRIPTHEGKTIPVRAIIGGVARHVLTLHALDVAWWRVNIRSGDVHGQLKAKALWSYGYEAVASWCLALWTWHATGTACELGDAWARGWRLTGLELCADFTGIRFFREDAAHFIGARVSGDEGHDVIVWGEQDRWGGEGPANTIVETINIGRRTTSPLSLCIYDKSRQVDAVKSGDASTYAAVWGEHGWAVGEHVTRVELRLNGRALCMEDASTGELLDFTHPGRPADLDALRRLWWVACYKRRLVTPGEDTHRDRWRLDPRWQSVLAVAPEQPGKWRQLRLVQKDTHAERVRRAARDASRGLHRFAGLHGFELDGFAVATRALAYAFHVASQEDDLGRYGQDYAAEQAAVLGPEIEAARRVFSHVIWSAATGSHPPPSQTG